MATVEQSLNDAGADLTAPGEVQVYCPADGRLVGAVPDMGPEQVAELAARLRRAQPAWEAIGPDGRAHHLLRWLDWIFDNEDRILADRPGRVGQVAGDTKIETMVAAEVINYYAKNAGRVPRPRSVTAAQRRRRDEEPAPVPPPLPAGRADLPVELPARHADDGRPAGAHRRRGGPRASPRSSRRWPGPR